MVKSLKLRLCIPPTCSHCKERGHIVRNCLQLPPSQDPPKKASPPVNKEKESTKAAGKRKLSVNTTTKVKDVPASGISSTKDSTAAINKGLEKSQAIDPPGPKPSSSTPLPKSFITVNPFSPLSPSKSSSLPPNNLPFKPLTIPSSKSHHYSSRKAM